MVFPVDSTNLSPGLRYAPLHLQCVCIPEDCWRTVRGAFRLRRARAERERVLMQKQASIDVMQRRQPSACVRREELTRVHLVPVLVLVLLLLLQHEEHRDVRVSPSVTLLLVQHDSSR